MGCTQSQDRRRMDLQAFSGQGIPSLAEQLARRDQTIRGASNLAWVRALWAAGHQIGLNEGFRFGAFMTSKGYILEEGGDPVQSLMRAPMSLSQELHTNGVSWHVTQIVDMWQRRAKTRRLADNRRAGIESDPLFRESASRERRLAEPNRRIDGYADWGVLVYLPVQGQVAREPIAQSPSAQTDIVEDYEECQGCEKCKTRRAIEVKCGRCSSVTRIDSHTRREVLCTGCGAIIASPCPTALARGVFGPTSLCMLSEGATYRDGGDLELEEGE